MGADSVDPPPQELRDRLATAIESNDLSAAEELLSREPLLANADLRPAEQRDQFTNGFPLHRAARDNRSDIVTLFLHHAARPDAPGSRPDDRPEFGMPLHFAAAEHRNYELANRLVDHGASPNGYPNCDKSTIERVFYHAREAGLPDVAVRRAFARYLPDREQLEARSASEITGRGAAEPIALFARMVDLGAQAPFCALVREGFDDLLMEIVDHSQDAHGPRHDHPNGSVIDNINGAARWYGYPRLVHRLREHPSYRYAYEDALGTIAVAIGSHNRDGTYADYREIIVAQLDALSANGDLQRARHDPEFQPLYEIATDFTWHSNYGYRAAIAAPECYVDLAELFLSYGIGGVEFRDPQNGHSPLSAAVARGEHPGIAVYIRWLLDKGADTRSSDPAPVNPIAIARDKGLAEIQRMLESRSEDHGPP